MSGDLVRSPAQVGLITDTLPGSLSRITAIVQNVDSTSVQVALNSERFTDVRTTEKVLVKRAAPSGVMSEEVLCCILTTTGGNWSRYAFGPQDSDGDVSKKVLKCAAVLSAVSLTDDDGTEHRLWLVNGMASIRAQYLKERVTGFIVLDVRREYVALLRTTLTKREGLVALEGEAGGGHNFYTVFPKYCDLRAETEALIVSLPEGTKITRLIGNQRFMGRDDSGLGVMVDQDWVRLQLTLDKWPTYLCGPEILWNASGPSAGSPHSGTMIALGVEGEGGRRALEAFLYSMLGVQCAVALDNRSVD